MTFIWLFKGPKPKQDAFYDFINNKLIKEVLDDLHYQFIRRLDREELVTLKNLYIDGTKFFWRGSINYYLVGLLDKIDMLYSRYNALIKYGLHEKRMFVTDGIGKVRAIIKKNRERKISRKKKMLNNRILEIDNISPVDLLRMQLNQGKLPNKKVYSSWRARKIEVGNPKNSTLKLKHAESDCLHT